MPRIGSFIKHTILGDFVSQVKLQIRHNRYKNKPIETVFTKIKDEKLWSSDESLSGVGSEYVHTVTLIKELETLLKTYNINSILDIPCGDFNWMKSVSFNEVNYIGADLVNELVEENNNRYASEKITFVNLDLTKDPLPKVDLMFCRDCLVHLSNHYIYKALQNIKKSNSKYLLTTSFVDVQHNKNIITGDWRKLNFSKSPFNFPKPLLTIDENYVDKKGIKSDKTMCLYLVESIKLPLRLKLYYWFSK